ncbi:unnamed protein product [Arctia plantaginis]|uniref:Uncharacterized protein n=1 Tax=Arctia plantaginis TaxID=874455 RepID=A0A8S0ZES1_ARCPL|nr:unnamed protein product [Arctia plantaginis]CAB3232037.1 unnamed protein product [Arctia plantaginis]
MSLFNQEELEMIAIALDEEEADDQEDYQQAIKRICELWEDRETAGEYNTLCLKLTRHPKYYYDYFKMSESTFQLLLQKLQDGLRKKILTGDNLYRQWKDSLLR